MNYYPFHVGDYAAHTAHLEPLEDIAYRRMLDWYYLNEKALPADAAKVARLVRMPKFKSAVESVLSEFFVLAEDGWHNKRADAELTGMLAKQEQQSVKDAHEAERMKRHRERRAEMFAALRAVNIIPAWDVPIKELQRLVEASCNGAKTDLQREQVPNSNATATAIPTPTPTPTPTPIIKEKAQAPADLRPPDVDESTWDEFVQFRKRKKAQITPLVVSTMIERANAVGMTTSEAIRHWVMSGTVGFFPPDQKSRYSSQPINRQAAIESANKAAGDAWLERKQRELEEESRTVDAA